MRSSALLAIALAGVVTVRAHPFVVTVTDVEVVYTTVTDGAPVPPQQTDEAPERNWSWTGHGWWSKPAAATTSSPPPPPPPSSTPAAEDAEPTIATPTPTPTPEPQPAATSTTAAAPAPATTGSYDSPNGDVYAQRVIDHHNVHRANNSACDVTWDGNLASIALEIANSCNYAHNVQAGGGGYGQNIAAGAPEDNITSVITDLFYNGEINNFAGLYGQATPDNINDDAAFDGYGHYTQIVWQGTTAVGCATVDCTGQGNGPNGLGNVASDVPPFFTVCNYSPPGNYLGEFAANVAEPLGNPTVNWDYDYN